MRTALILAASLLLVSAAAAEQAAPANEISADQGPCAVRLKVTAASQKPVYLAKVSTRLQYGFAGSKRIDLEAFTDSAGELTVAGLPEIRKKPLLIRISKEQKEVLVEYKPQDNCQAHFDAVLPLAR